MKLHLGSGFKRYDGFVNVDYDKDCNPDYVVDLEKDTWPFEDNSVDDVIAHHILEHLGDGYFHFMKELYRVCENGALIDIVVPHHRHEYFLNDPTHRRPITVDGLKLFNKAYNDYCVSIGDGSSKLGHFFNVDFDVVDFNYHFDPFYDSLLTKARAGDEDAQKQMEFVIRTQNNVIAETAIKLIVIK